MATNTRLTLRQIDPNSAHLTKTYILSTTSPARGPSTSRLDRLSPTSTTKAPSHQPHQSLVTTYLTTTLQNLTTTLKLLFLPTGYPQSVTDDYTPYQIYDSIQAFASTIASLLSSRAVLQSLNVIATTSTTNDKSPDTPSSLPSTSAEAATAATLLSILQSTLSNLTTILFASYAAPRISPDVKFYRFLADVVNDAAFILDLLAPSLPPFFSDLIPSSLTISPIFSLLPTIHLPLPLTITPKVLTLCLSSTLRATCGVAGGSSKAVLSTHFARSNPESVGDLNAKDNSQETIINLIGMWVGGVLVSRVEGVAATWGWMALLLGVHLWANYRAVGSVVLRGMNRGRGGRVVGGIVKGEVGWEGRVSVENVARGEGILGVRGWTGGLIWGDEGREWRGWRVGVPIEEFLRAVHSESGFTKKRSGSLTLDHGAERLHVLLDAFRGERYIPWVNIKSGKIIIALKRGALPRDQLKAVLHATMALSRWRRSRTHTGTGNEGVADMTSLLVVVGRDIDERWDGLCMVLGREGWDLDSVNLEDGTGIRLEIEDGD